MTNSNLLKISQIVVLALFIGSIALNTYFLTKKDTVETIVTEKVDTIHDTITDVVPQVKYETHLRTIKDTLVQSITNQDTVRVEAYIPITQKVYANDSTYTAWVSGYRQNLDSIQVYNKTINIERTIEKTITKKPKFVFGPSITTGYDPINKNFGIMIGISGTFNLLK